jgi:GNAT superfamily N-acetyltransferase
VPAITIASAPADGPEAVACLQAYYDELDERFPEGFDVDATTSADAHELTPPRGDLLLVRHHDRPVGVGCVKMLGDGASAEVKRMWIAPSHRGRGLGARLLAELERRARELGASRAVLDTRRLLGAVSLYERNGYRATGPFNDNPYPDWWGEKPL